MPKVKEEPIFELDKTQLDVHWVEQPALMYKYCKELAEARTMVDHAKSEVQLIEAELSAKIRNEPLKYGIEKITEKAITEHIATHRDYQSAGSLLIRKKYDADVVQAYVTALDHRKKALEKLVDLHGQGYFATPVAKGANHERMDDVTKKSVRRKGR